MKTELTIESIFKQIDQLKENIDEDYREFQEKQKSKYKSQKTLRGLISKGILKITRLIVRT